MTDAAPNPLAPSRAHARNQSSRALALKQLKSCSAFTSEQALAAITPRRLGSATPRRALEKMTCEPESSIQIP